MLYDMDYTDRRIFGPYSSGLPPKRSSERPGPEQRGGAGMILQALTEYYQALEREGKIDAPGWIKVKVSYALCLAVDGTLERVDFMQTEQPRGKKMVLAPQSISLPAPVKRTVGVAANFLCDNSSYFLGIDNKGKSQRTQECFAACKALHESLLKDVDSPAAQAVLAFFRTWDPQEARENPALKNIWTAFLLAET